MPPIAALILCTGFVVFLLRLEHKKSPEISVYSWLPTIWILLISSKPLGRWFGFVSEVESGSPLDRLFLIILLFLSLIILKIKNLDWQKIAKENFIILIIIVFMLISIIWSDNPYISFKRWTRELVAVVIGSIILSESKPIKAVETILRRTVYILLPYSYLLIHYFPLYGREYHRWSGEIMWIGVTLQKNGLGRLCMIAVFFQIWSLIKRLRQVDNSSVKYQFWSDVIVLLISLLLLKGPSIRAMSASGLVSLGIAGLIFFIIMHFNVSTFMAKINFLKIVSVSIIILGTVTVFVGGSTLSSISSVVGRDDTLTGRTEIWAGLLPVAMERIEVGHGVGGFWTSETQQEHKFNEAHSGYLEILLHYGFIGLILFSIFIITYCRRAVEIHKQDYYWSALCCSILLMALVHNIVESSIESFGNQLTTLILYLWFSMSNSNSIQQDRLNTK